MNPVLRRHAIAACAVLLLAGCSDIVREKEGHVGAEELDEAPEQYIVWEDIPEPQRPEVLVTVMEEAVHGPGLRGGEVVSQDMVDAVDDLLRGRPGYQEEWGPGLYFMKYNNTFFQVSTGYFSA